MNNKKEALAKRLAEVDKHLEQKRLKWNLGIFAGYSLAISILITISVLNTVDSVIFAWVYSLIPSILLGGLCYWINSLVWTNCCWSIRDTLDYQKQLEKEWKELVAQEEKSNCANNIDVSSNQTVPNKYLNRGYDEFQIEYIREAIYKYGLCEKDIDYFLSLRNEPILLMEYSLHLKYEIEDYIEDVARDKAAKEVLRIHK